MSSPKAASGQDLAIGVQVTGLAPDAMIHGHVGEDEVVLARAGGEWFAVGARCTHYKGRLDRGLIVGDTIRCPLHHACFSLRTGEALRAPAFDPIPRWRVEVIGEQVFVREKLAGATTQPLLDHSKTPESIVIIGGGAAGSAAADMLRREGYTGPITMISADADLPVDRPNLSKDYLAGEAQDDWMPIWPAESYQERGIDLRLHSRVSAIDPATRAIALDNGSPLSYGALLIATGADPVHPPIPGADSPSVSYLRTYADARAIVERAQSAKHVVVIGASFIGLEVSASLRARGIAVDVIAPEQTPLERVLGPEIGRFVQTLHEAKGVVFHLGQSLKSVDGRTVTLGNGETLDADFVVMGVGVRPALGLAEKAGLAIDKGIAVNEFLETSAPGIFAAGDAARWPDPHTGERIRVEHWVVAQRMGQAAARNMLGRRERFDAVPFFWSRHYDIGILYVGHAEKWDAIHIDGSLEARDCEVTYTLGGKRLAVATIKRQRQSLAAEAEFERLAQRS
jgi:NADPH-dependent 2,4-dienoyl-CoA reductase/sulfur reductase-like enzyme/nitrite reductase/ring-hydroxylating ferredoxin subunit